MINTPHSNLLHAHRLKLRTVLASVRGCLGLERVTGAVRVFISNLLPMKKTFAALAVASLLFVPSLSFAATTYTPAQITALQQLLTLLEKELAAVLSQQAAPSAIGTASLGTQPIGGVSPGVQVSVANKSATPVNGSGQYDVTFNVTNDTGSTIYIPLTSDSTSSGTQGFSYTVSGSSTTGQTETDSVTCSSTQNMQLGTSMSVGSGSTSFVNACVIAAGSSQQITVKVTVGENTSGNYSVSFDSMNYTSSTASPFSYASASLAAVAGPIYISSPVAVPTTITSGGYTQVPIPGTDCFYEYPGGGRACGS